MNIDMTIKRNILKITGLTLISLLYPLFLSAQQLSVGGHVADSYGDPLPGVTVIEKGTTNGVTTDAEGSYSVVVRRKDAVLSFS